MATTQAITELPSLSLTKIASGKVRDLFDIDEKTLLFVASDRISAYDVVMEDGIPSKGQLLNLISIHWFNLLPTLVPSLKHHFLALDLPASVPEDEKALLKNRSMQVRKLKVFPIECIVRGYLTGSAWKEYEKEGTVHSIPCEPGLKRCEVFPQGPLYTPSTKAPAGEHDLNITPAQAAEIVGHEYASKIERLALDLYKAARDYARDRGIIIADTKFEFGLDEATKEIVLIDEVLTPDSSRFWDAGTYEVGREQDSFDKQYLRNWLTKNGLNGKQGVRVPEEVVLRTARKYQEVFERLTGRKWEDAVRA